MKTAVAWSPVLLFSAALLLFLFQGNSCASPGETINEIRSRNVLRCGIGEGPSGFSLKDGAGNWQGIGPDFCRAVAAAALGGANKVEFMPLSAAARFPVLLSGRVDLLAHTATMTFEREAGIGVLFPGIYFFDAQGFMVLRSSKTKTIRDLDGAKVCVVKGTTQQTNLINASEKYKLKLSAVVADSVPAAVDALNRGRCQAVTADRSLLVAIKAGSPGNAKLFEIIPGVFSIEPIGPAVRRGDEEWSMLVRWVLYALIEAEALGITRENVQTLLKSPGTSEIRDFLIKSGQSGKFLGLRSDWVASVIVAAGNYGEIYERHFGSRSRLKIDRGLNRLWKDGGLIYAPLFQ